MAQTKATDLVNPQVMADAIAAKLPKAIRFAPYARVDTTLVGTHGDTITRPKYAYIGPAEDLVEGVPMEPAKMSMTTTSVTVKEAGKAVEVTEKAILTNVAGTVANAEDQILKSIADKIEIDYLAALDKTKLVYTGNATSAQGILNALDVLDDEEEMEYVLFINNKDYSKLVASLFAVGGDVAQRAISKADVAELVGVKDIVKTKRLAAGTSYIQRQGAVEIVYKKRPEINKDGDILARTVVLAGNTYYATNLYDDSGVVKVRPTA